MPTASAIPLVLLLLLASGKPPVVTLSPPVRGFFAKALDCGGIPVMASAAVADDALYAARDRLDMMLAKIPDARRNLATLGAELHVIGKDQVTSDLPEHRHLKGKPFDGKLTVDERTRGLGGLLTSCGEENLLGLPGDRYAGRDICVHEFAHSLQENGLSDSIRAAIRKRYEAAIAEGLWKSAYAATNEGEFFAELSMWYFGTHGDLGMRDPKPAVGREGLRAYDPKSLALIDDIYTGRLPIERIELVDLAARPASAEATTRSRDSSAASAILFVNETPRAVRLYWLDSSGAREPYGTVDAGGKRSQSTFDGHAWVVTDDALKPLALFVAGPRPARAVVTETAPR